MTIKELRDLLSEYPENAEVFVIRERIPFGSGAGTLKEIEVRVVVDQDTNIGSVVISPKIESGDVN